MSSILQLYSDARAKDCWGNKQVIPRRNTWAASEREVTRLLDLKLLFCDPSLKIILSNSRKLSLFMMVELSSVRV